MARKTPLHHPKAAAQGRQFFPHKVTFKATQKNGIQSPILETRCAYEAAISRDSADFEFETPAADKILIPAWHPEIIPGLLVVLELDGITKQFKVNDAAPVGSPSQKTLVSITPKP